MDSPDHSPDNVSANTFLQGMHIPDVSAIVPIYAYVQPICSGGIAPPRAFAGKLACAAQDFAMSPLGRKRI